MEIQSGSILERSEKNCVAYKTSTRKRQTGRQDTRLPSNNWSIKPQSKKAKIKEKRR